MTTEGGSVPQLGDVVAEKYRIDRVLGEGGMGTVFAATHLLTHKQVALKWMLPSISAGAEGAERFLREAQIAARIEHANVINIFDVGKHDGALFLVMELLRGEPLSARLARGPLPPSTVARMLVPALRGLAAAHANGVVHRDLKPDNIFLCESADGTAGEAKVLDFGISKLATGGRDSGLALTKTGAAMGTPYYMSPEQIRGEKGIDQRTDVYSMGVVLYEALAGRTPFDGDSFGALAIAIATANPPPLRQFRPEVPEGLAAVVRRAMSREPDARYADMRALIGALEPFLGLSAGSTDGSGRLVLEHLHTSSNTTPLASESLQPAAWVPPMHRSGLWLVAGFVAAAVAIAGWLLASSSSRGTPHMPEATPRHAAHAQPEPAAPSPPRALEPEQLPMGVVAPTAVQAPAAETPEPAIPKGASLPPEERHAGHESTKQSRKPTATPPTVKPVERTAVSQPAPTPKAKVKPRSSALNLNDFK